MTPRQLNWCEQCVPGAYRRNYRVAMLGRKVLVAIRQKCLDCQNWQLAEVRTCPVEYCPLWPYRMGKRQRDPNAKPRTTSPGVPKKGQINKDSAPNGLFAGNGEREGQKST